MGPSSSPSRSLVLSSLHVLVLIGTLLTPSSGSALVRVYFDGANQLDVEIRGFDYTNLTTDCLMSCRTSSERLTVSGQKFCQSGNTCVQRAYMARVSNEELIIMVSRNAAGNATMFTLVCQEPHHLLQFNNQRLRVSNYSQSFSVEANFTVDCFIAEKVVTTPGFDDRPTDTGPNSPVVAAATITASCFVIALIIVVVFIIRRRKKNDESQPYEKTVPLEGEHNYSGLRLSTREPTSTQRDEVTEDELYEPIE